MDQDFEIKGGRLIKYTGPGGDVAVPEGVTDISEDAFQTGPRGNELITSVYLPEGVVRIAQGAFRGCRRLNRVHLPDSLREIGGKHMRGAFEHCDSLRSIRIPGGVTVLPEYIFDSCENLREVYLPKNMWNQRRGVLSLPFSGVRQTAGKSWGH